MKLKVTDRVEQGTPRGVMKFQAGKEYACEQKDEGDYLVDHEPRTEQRRVKEGDKKVRKAFSVSQTLVPKRIVDKMLALGVATLEN